MNLHRRLPSSTLFLVAWIVPSLIAAFLVVNPPKFWRFPASPTSPTDPLWHDMLWTLGLLLVIWSVTGLLPWWSARRWHNAKPV